MTDDEAVARGFKSYELIQETDDFAEGPMAFLQKRAPQWTG